MGLCLSGSGALPAAIVTHDLRKVALAAGFELHSGEEDFLRVVSDSLISWGRYPGGRRHDVGDLAPPADFRADVYQAHFDAIWTRVTEAVSADLDSAYDV